MKPAFSQLLFITLIGFTNVSIAFAQNAKNKDDESTHGGYLQLGVGITVADNLIDDDTKAWISVPVEGRYHWRKAFAEVSSENVVLPGFGLGYEMLSGNKWSIDLFATMSDFGYRAKDFDRLEDSNIDDRHPGALAGVRGTLFVDHNIFQLHLMPAGNRGSAAAFAAGRHWQLRNWSFAAFVATRYNSADLNDYYFGVDEGESSADFPEYEAGSGFQSTAELAVEKPLFRRWVFKTALRHVQLASTVADSPILSSRNITLLRMQFSYVF